MREPEAKILFPGLLELSLITLIENNVTIISIFRSEEVASVLRDAAVQQNMSRVQAPKAPRWSQKNSYH